MGAPTRSLENLSLVLQNQKINDFFDKLSDMKKHGSRKIRLEIMEGEKTRIRGRTIRLLPNKQELHDKVNAIITRSDIREANRLVLSLVSKGLGILEEQDVDGNIRATMTPEAHKRYKENQQKPKTSADNNKKRVAYSNVTEVSKEDFHKLAKVACDALKIELEPLKQEKKEVQAEKEGPKEKGTETESHAKPHLKEALEQPKESHDAPDEAASSKAGKSQEESQSKKILEEQQAHAAADREKEKAEKEREQAAAVVRKEVKLEERHEEVVKAEVTKAEQTKSQLKESVTPNANPASKPAPLVAQMLPNVNPAVLKPAAAPIIPAVVPTPAAAPAAPLPTPAKIMSEPKEASPKDAASSISDELAAIEPPPPEDQ